jgi:hypothetical protein
MMMMMIPAVWAVWAVPNVSRGQELASVKLAVPAAFLAALGSTGSGFNRRTFACHNTLYLFQGQCGAVAVIDRPPVGPQLRARVGRRGGIHHSFVPFAAG